MWVSWEDEGSWGLSSFKSSEVYMVAKDVILEDLRSTDTWSDHDIDFKIISPYVIA